MADRPEKHQSSSSNPGHASGRQLVQGSACKGDDLRFVGPFKATIPSPSVGFRRFAPQKFFFWMEGWVWNRGREERLKLPHG